MCKLHAMNKSILILMSPNDLIFKASKLVIYNNIVHRPGLYYKHTISANSSALQNLFRLKAVVEDYPIMNDYEKDYNINPSVSSSNVSSLPLFGL